ncbi:MAG: saccharopine dehydrogenase NADP-binding domain-containing protein [Woeseiaceae bacterium]|nr:saccharopine dehydrogenase NADP-binding domain-containing protein [Woeseiaceae bacterium]
MSERELDVIVYGATGFTGQLVAEYLEREYGVDQQLRWAIAGRSKNKLEQVRAALGESAAPLPIIVADSSDTAALAELAGRARVVLTTVGPYALYGSKLVEACVRAGTHYCDLAGEVQWIRKMIDTHHAAARESGARIVHCCGFDSIPMDMGVWFLQNEAKRRFDNYCGRIALYVKATKGGPSGGTLASMANIVEEARADRDIARILMHPYSLNPEGEREGPDGYDQQKVLYDKDAGCWTAPFVMAGVNTKVVRRSNALAGYPYGRDFQYREAVLSGKGVSGWLKGTSVVLGVGGLMLGMSFGPTRRFLQRFVLPKPGEGPDRETQKTGFFNLMQIGHLPDGTKIRSRITGDQDPGYGSTSKMLAEAAVCLAKDSLETTGGVWTPASAMGRSLLDRLVAKAGLTFDIVD